MRSLGGKVQESTFCDILHNAVLQVCREKYWADSPDWEVDGVICISVPHSQEQHVVKIHQKFPSDSGKHFDNRCFECDRKPKDALSTNETSERHFNESVEEDDSSYRNVSVIDLEHASTQPNPAQTCGQGTIPPSLPSPVREQNSHNFYASPDLSGFGPNVHRQKSEQLKNSSGQSHSKTNNRSKDQEHSSSFTSHPRETTPPRKKSKTEPEEYVVVKAEPDDDEDFALHMECIDEKESDNTAEIKDENIQRDLAAETQEDINFLLNVEGPSASHQFNSGDRSWGQRLPTSTVTSQMDTNLSSMAGQGSQGFSNLNLLTHGVDIEDGTMRLTTRVQHPSFIAGQTDSNTPEQRTIPRPSGQDSAAASNAIGVGGSVDHCNNADNSSGFIKSAFSDRYQTDKTGSYPDQYQWLPTPRFVVNRTPSSLPQRGFVDPEIAAKHQMVELVSGSKVYVYQSDIDMAMKHGVDRRMSAQQGHTIRDGTKMARYVMSLFWSEKELIGRTITPTPRNKDLIPLDINLLSAILDFCISVSSNTRAQVKEALRNKVTAANTRAKFKRSNSLTPQSNPNDQRVLSTLQSIPNDQRVLSTLQSIPNDQRVLSTPQSIPNDQRVFATRQQDILPDQDFNVMPLSNP
ncbi:uncharacterized protein LOC117328731 isoform X2 [Pecten maximus]|uniref:uncharacterized protein LOC117328731 isoform X2 n=1 Tax=Pecten maximus TaxID=6579 RepID=UPI001458CE9B|nr:uncharacterized protein LOC117328731 isoform X2 [Pecten maximus]